MQPSFVLSCWWTHYAANSYRVWNWYEIEMEKTPRFFSPGPRHIPSIQGLSGNGGDLCWKLLSFLLIFTSLHQRIIWTFYLRTVKHDIWWQVLKGSWGPFIWKAGKRNSGVFCISQLMKNVIMILPDVYFHQAKTVITFKANTERGVLLTPTRSSRIPTFYLFPLLFIYFISINLLHISYVNYTWLEWSVEPLKKDAHGQVWTEIS